MARDELKNRLKLALELNEKRAIDLCNDLNLAKSTVSQYLNGKSKNMPADRLNAMAKYLNVSEPWLMGYDVPMQRTVYHSEYGQYGFHPVEKRRIPLLGDVACGEPIIGEEEVEYIALPDEVPDADYALKARGDSMIGARIRDGDIIFVKQQSTVENGDIAVVLVEKEATLKRVHFDERKKQMILSPENPLYSPMVFVGEELEDVEILGKAVAFQSPIE